jgi:hypothetical protein
MTKFNGSECILLFYHGSMVAYLGVVYEYEGIFVILIDNSLVINIKFNQETGR